MSGEGNVAVYLRLLTALGTAAARTDDPARRDVLRTHVGRVREAAARTLDTDYERDQVQAHAREVEELLAGEKAEASQ